jgi:formate/nitrite transporter FocA (FNT family)
MLWVTLGNIVSGSVIMALGYWVMSSPRTSTAPVKLFVVGGAAD